MTAENEDGRVRRSGPLPAPWIRAGISIAIALAGAGLATALGLPAGSLVGALLAVALAGSAGIAVTIPRLALDLAFLVIGVSMGAGIDAEILTHLSHWTVSLVGLAVSLVLTVFVSAWMLIRFFGMDRNTAFLASIPGMMANVLAMTLADPKIQAPVVTFLQLIRVIVLVAIVPPVSIATGSAAATGVVTPAAMPLLAFVALLLVCLPLGRLAERFGIAAACLLTGLLASGGLHAFGLVEGAAPAWAVFVAMALTGAAVGARSDRVDWRLAPRLLLAGVVVVLAALGVALLSALVTSGLTGLPMGQVLIAYAPGAVEAMAAIGLALGYDPTYVAAHHFARIVLVLAMMPLLLRR